MIVVNGMEYKTLRQNLYVNNKKVIEAYCNGKLVYPERENSQLLKVVGHIDMVVGHDHTGENPSATSNVGDHYTYHYGDGYRAKGCFSLVLRNYSTHVHNLRYDENVSKIPAAKYPLNGSSIDGNVWVVFPYTASTAPMLPNGGAIHPLYGSDAIPAHIISTDSNGNITMSLEILLDIDVSAPRVCPFYADRISIYGIYDAEAEPMRSYTLDEVPSDVNGRLNLIKYRNEIRIGTSPTWTLTGKSGKRFSVSLSSLGSYSETASNLFKYVRISTVDDYDISYHISGTDINGVHREVQTTYSLGFNILNIPITDKIYLGSEMDAPEEHLHPRIEDIAEYI